LKIRAVIPLWRRPEVTKFCFDGMLELIASSKHEIAVSCVLSEPEFIPLCEEYGFNWVFENNDPLGKKINSGIKSTLKYKYDYLMMMNSDDVVKTELIDKWYDPYFEKLNPYFGVKKVTFVNFHTHEAKEYTYEFSVLGIGKMVHRSVVDLLKGELYPWQLNKGLDDHMMDRMISCKISPTFVDYDGMLAMDFKSETNIWPWEHFAHKGKTVCYKQKLEEAN
jgi:hypothetical protein